MFFRVLDSLDFKTWPRPGPRILSHWRCVPRHKGWPCPIPKYPEGALEKCAKLGWMNAEMSTGVHSELLSHQGKK